MPSRTHPPRRLVLLLWVVFSAVFAALAGAQSSTQATTVPLILPGGLAYDVAGNLYFAETGNHWVQRVTPQGIITTVAGTGVQGFAGDGGLATAAELDSPASIALDPAGDLFIADTHNHRIRRVDASSGIISTYAGAVAGQMDFPSALAFDSAQNLFFADQRTHLIQRIDHASYAITTAAGNGTQGYAGDGGAATLASIDSPSGIALDATGAIFLAHTHNQRILRVDAATGAVSTIAGDGTQQFAGDNASAVAASLDTPRALTISPAGLPTLSDAGNQRVRQVDATATIHTVAGLGVTTGDTLTLSAPAVTLYGSGLVTATLAASAATGSVTFFDTVANATVTLATTPLFQNAAGFATSALAAGVHSFTATYPGDTLHSAAQSGALGVTISPAPLLATPAAVALLYGEPVPALSGSLAGVLAQDAGLVRLLLASNASALSPPAVYPITATVTGASAGNYTLSETPAAVTIVQAPATVTLSNTLAVHVASTTTGEPTGLVTLYDGANVYASAVLSAGGDAAFSPANLSVGTHTLTAKYGGDSDFLAAASGPLLDTIGAPATADFSLAATGQTTVTVAAGTAAAFSFAVNPLNGALSSPIQLTASGLPLGAKASFNPAYLPPANTPAAFILTIQTAKAVAQHHRTWLTYALLLPLFLLLRKRRAGWLAALLLLAGCGDRVNTSEATAASVSYNITVSGTATTTSGATLQHSATVVLTIQ